MKAIKAEGAPGFDRRAEMAGKLDEMVASTSR
jgi:hypothetical protein